MEDTRSTDDMVNKTSEKMLGKIKANIFNKDKSLMNKINMWQRIKARVEATKRPWMSVYRDRTGRWRWRLVSINGRIIADSGQGYRNKEDCLYGSALAGKYFE